MSWHRVDWLSFAQAVAATLAVIAAFTVVFTQNRLERQRQRERDWQRACVVASLLTMRLSIYRSEITKAQRRMQDINQFDGAPLTFRDYANELVALGEWPLEQIVALIPLPNQCAHQLAGGIDRVQVAASVMADFYKSSGVHDGIRRKETAGELSGILGEADKMLKAACNETQMASFGRLRVNAVK
jgi:hypothetical protein